MSDLTTAELFHRNVSELSDIDLLVALRNEDCCVDDFRDGSPDHPHHPEQLHWQSWLVMKHWGLVDDNGVTPLGLDHIIHHDHAIFRKAVRLRDAAPGILS